MKCTRCKKEIDVSKTYMTLQENKREREFCFDCGSELERVEKELSELKKIRKEFFDLT